MLSPGQRLVTSAKGAKEERNSCPLGALRAGRTRGDVKRVLTWAGRDLEGSIWSASQTADGRRPGLCQSLFTSADALFLSRQDPGGVDDAYAVQDRVGQLGAHEPAREQEPGGRRQDSALLALEATVGGGGLSNTLLSTSAFLSRSKEFKGGFLAFPEVATELHVVFFIFFF